MAQPLYPHETPEGSKQYKLGPSISSYDAKRTEHPNGLKALYKV